MGKTSLKPFDKVLVRDSDNGEWGTDLYAYRIGEDYFGLGKISWRQCIPYEGNEHLLGTTDSPEPRFEKGDIVLAWDEGDSVKRIRVYSHFDNELHKHVDFNVLLSDGATTEGYMWDYCEKFAPASVEEGSAT